MNRAVEANDIKPIVDDKVFTLDEAKDAYQYMWDQKASVHPPVDQSIALSSNFY
jgi:hypothetical protein